MSLGFSPPPHLAADTSEDSHLFIRRAGAVEEVSNQTHQVPGILLMQKSDFEEQVPEIRVHPFQGFYFRHRGGFRFRRPKNIFLAGEKTLIGDHHHRLGQVEGGESSVARDVNHSVTKGHLFIA